MRIINRKFSRRNRIGGLMNELHQLRSSKVETEIISNAKDEAMRDYVNKWIARWNTAIRSTNGMRRGETMQSYNKRLVEANARLS